MLLYRICKCTYKNDLSGAGSALYGGRWNPRGTQMLYTAGSTSLAYLEHLVHNMHILNTKTVCLSIIEVPDKNLSIQELPNHKLPHDWDEKTYLPMSTQNIGYQFLQESNSHLLKVPSAIVANEFNFLLNPLHKNHNNIKIKKIIEPFEIDERLK